MDYYGFTIGDRVEVVDLDINRNGQLATVTHLNASGNVVVQFDRRSLGWDSSGQGGFWNINTRNICLIGDKPYDMD